MTASLTLLPGGVPAPGRAIGTLRARAEDWPLVRRLMREHGVTIESIVGASGAENASVRRVLDPQKFAAVRYEHVIHVRIAVYNRLLEEGWMGFPETLWEEEFDRLLIDEPEPPQAA